MHGIGQGNGAGPAILAVVSTLILVMLHLAGLGTHIMTPISQQETRYCSFSFVDDTDIIQTASSPQDTWRSVANGLQNALKNWEEDSR